MVSLVSIIFTYIVVESLYWRTIDYKWTWHDSVSRGIVDFEKIQLLSFVILFFFPLRLFVDWRFSFEHVCNFFATTLGVDVSLFEWKNVDSSQVSSSNPTRSIDAANTYILYD
jgi:uncharacterized protein involved in cysteine biosynthesis